MNTIRGVANRFPFQRVIPQYCADVSLILPRMLFLTLYPTLGSFQIAQKRILCSVLRSAITHPPFHLQCSHKFRTARHTNHIVCCPHIAPFLQETNAAFPKQKTSLSLIFILRPLEASFQCNTSLLSLFRAVFRYMLQKKIDLYAPHRAYDSIRVLHPVLRQY